MKTGIAGAGAFGTALALTLHDDGKDVLLWGRDPEATRAMQDSLRNPRLDGVALPETLVVTSDVDDLLACDTILLAIPAQTLRGFLTTHRAALSGKSLVACCKGIDLETLTGPVASIRDTVPDSTAAILTGPSFAADIARGLPTALTLACEDEKAGEILQQSLSTRPLRLYLTTDVVGAELGGALKNVVAIACGVTIGAGLGDSARAALMTRGFAEMQRLAASLGADPQTLTGLSGFGDLALTCTSDLSRNYAHGLALGAGRATDPTKTVEGAATAQAVTRLAETLGLDLPVCRVVAGLTTGALDVKGALDLLLSRPLRRE